ncbi:protein of unknown function [Sanguibacter gelidistatuariae]|uniref:DUF4307 domain-containing protein n=1 Tax=Sanguibacter gelidistatuariae TaxID=1814289 RepID=A0A1G6QK51_9MICO|nr:DUF4307 domain-containing protein [Sanguibacter gelidistatuariae]SDC92067.1 protein of unknown function [Sanguibacter gelidistatuariae]
MPEQLDPSHDSSHDPESTTPHDLGTRYTTAPNPRARRLKFAGSVAGIAVMVAIAAYLSFGNTASSVRGQEFGFSVKGPEAIDITFDVAKPKDATVICTLNALNTNYAQVGTKDVTIGPSDVGEARYTTQIATTELAVTAVIESCTLVD